MASGLAICFKHLSPFKSSICLGVIVAKGRRGGVPVVSTPSADTDD